MKNIRQDLTGLPIKTQLFGGFRKSDVTDYIKRLVEEIEAERGELKKEKAQVYDLMKKTKVFCDNLTAESQQKADEMLQAAQEKSEKLLDDTDKELERIYKDRQLMLTQSQAEAKKLAGIITRQKQEAAEAYDELLHPVEKLLRSFGGGQDAT